MTTKNESNLQERFDEAVDAVRRHTPSFAEQEAARARVLARLGGADVAPDASAPIRGCADVRALFRAYRAGTLADAREMLVQDHLRECAECRAAFANRRVAKVVGWRTPSSDKPVARRGRFAVAAVMAVVVGGAGWFFRDAFTGPGDGPRASLESASGPVYLLAKAGVQKVDPGGALGEGEWLRTAMGARAVLRLADGSRVEVNQQSELGVSLRRKDVTIRLERGSIIVRAAKRREGHLAVATEEATAVVTGTVFSVNRGIKGTRVSVIEGSVRVEGPGKPQMLSAGEQWSSSRFVTLAPVREEIAWSAEAEQHVALLKELSALDRTLETVRLPGLRYASALVDRLPGGTPMVAAIPNYGEAIKAVHAIIEDRLQRSEVLRRWWEKEGPGNPSDLAEIGRVIDSVRAIAGHLGDEIVFALSQPDGRRNAQPVFLAEIRRPGVRELIGRELERLGVGARVRIHDAGGLASAAARAEDGLEILVTEQLLAVAPDVDSLRAMTAPTAAGFSRTPFGQRLGDAYRDGAGLLFAADLGRITARLQAEANGKGKPKVDPQAVMRELGADDVQYLVVEHEKGPVTTHNRATLSFAGPRKGVASWLAAPAPMGSLDFVRPGASFAASFVVKEPALVLDDLLRFAEIVSGDGKTRAETAALEARVGVALRDDLAGPLGNEITVALDGPLLPVPSWKVVMEVHDPDRLAATIERLVVEANRRLAAAGKPPLTVERTDAAAALGDKPGPIVSRHFHGIKAPAGKMPFALHYVFADGYLIMAPSDALLAEAIRTRRRGQTLRRTGRFRELLPADREPNFSAVVYHNLGEAGSAVGGWLSGNQGLAPEQKDAVEHLLRSAKPGLVYAYGEANQIQVASAGGVFGLSLEHFIGSASLGDLFRARPERGPAQR